MPRIIQAFSIVACGLVAGVSVASAATVQVVAKDLQDVLDQLYLDHECMGVSNPAETAVKSGDILPASLECCKESCQGALCQQRSECEEGDESVAPNGDSTGTIQVFIIEQSSANGGGASQSDVSQPMAVSQATIITTGGSTFTIKPSSASPSSSNQNSVSESDASPALQSSGPAAIVGGSEIPVPSAIATLTDTDGPIITFGPNGIAAGSTTLPLPTVPTTFTTEKLTLTFGGKVSPGEGSATTATTALTNSAGASALTASPLPTSDPSREISQHGVMIELDEQSYMLPETGSVEILQLDGSTATLFPESIVSGSQTASIDPTSPQTGIPFGHSTVDTSQIEDSPTPADGATGFGGFINSLDNLASGASSISRTFDHIDDLGSRWLASSLSDLEFSTTVRPLFDDIVPALRNFESTLRSTLRSFHVPRLELTSDGQRLVFHAYDSSQLQYDIMANLRRLNERYLTLKDGTIGNMSKRWQSVFVGGGAAGSAAVTLKLFAQHDWRSEKQQPILPTTTSTDSEEAVRPTRKRTSTSSSASDSATPVPYLLSSKDGTNPTVFDAYLKSISDGRETRESKYPDLEWQSFMLNLTEEQVKDAESQPFIRFVIRVPEPVEEPIEGDSQPESQRRAVQDLTSRQNSDNHLKVISVGNQRRMGPAEPLPDYIFDPVLGKGQTIYVLDDGFNLDHVEFAPGDGNRWVSSHVIPNRLTLARVKNPGAHAAEDIRTYSGHGTHVASIAAGLTHGVASKANLVLVKHKNAAITESGRYVNHQATIPAVEEAWRWIMQDVTERRKRDDTGKFIVNFSGGFALQERDGMSEGAKSQLRQQREILEDKLKKCWERDIVTVFAAGDDGDFQDNHPIDHPNHFPSDGSLDQFTPQSYGTTENAMITVGGVYNDGQLWLETTYDRGEGGSISVYAPSYRVQGAGPSSNDETVPLDGTSHSAPAVAGLAAYFASLQSLKQEFPEGQVAKAMKDYIVRYAYKRTNNPIRGNYYDAPPKNSIIVAYNRAQEGLCSSDASQSKRSLLKGANMTALARRQDSGDIEVVAEGDVVASSWRKSYCATTTTTTTSSSSAWSTTKTSTGDEPSPTADEPTETAGAPALTFNIARGILTCGTRTLEDDGDLYFFGLDEMIDARKAFCEDVTSRRPAVMFEPGDSPREVDYIYYAPNAKKRKIRVSAKWVAGADSDCEVFDFTRKDWYTDEHHYNGYAACNDRIDVPIQNCDTKQGDHALWKQGGKFFRNCITWEITAVPPA